MLAVVGLALLPAAASAHAYLISTSPPFGGVVGSSPTRVTLTFDEGISVPTLAVYSAAGRRVDSGTVMHPVADTIAVTIPHRLATGTYTVAWRVTSADTHVVHGVFTFSVGRRGRAGAIGAKLLARGQVPGGIAFGFGVIRFGNLLLLLLCGGGAAALVLVLRDVPADVRRVLWRALTVAGSLLVLLAALGLPFEAAEENGSSLLAGFGAGALAVVRHQRFGEVWLVRAWLAMLFALFSLSLQLRGRRWRTPREVALALLGICLLLTATASGHASVGGVGAFIADGAHITAAAAWLGGLVFVLAAVAVSPARARWRLAMRTVPRFSLLATVAVAVLGVAGVISAYLEVGAWRGTVGHDLRRAGPDEDRARPAVVGAGGVQQPHLGTGAEGRCGVPGRSKSVRQNSRGRGRAAGGDRWCDGSAGRRGTSHDRSRPVGDREAAWRDNKQRGRTVRARHDPLTATVDVVMRVDASNATR